MRNACCIALTALLAGCGGVPSVPYVDPPQSADTARMRVITNASVYGDSITSNCAPRPRHLMAQSGREYEDGTPHQTWAQYPLKTSKIEGMPKRIAPKFIDLKPSIRMAEGMYVEVETEHLVPTNAPFQITTLGAAMGGYGSSYPVCRQDAKVFDLDAGQYYEVVVGMNPRKTPEGEQMFCVLTVYKMISLGKSGLSLPLPLEPKPAPTKWCDK